MDSKNEKWFQSRRVWGAILSAVAISLTVAFPEQYDLISMIAVAGAGMLGLSSWTMPKQK